MRCFGYDVIYGDPSSGHLSQWSPDTGIRADIPADDPLRSLCGLAVDEDGHLLVTERSGVIRRWTNAPEFWGDGSALEDRSRRHFAQVNCSWVGSDGELLQGLADGRLVSRRGDRTEVLLGGHAVVSGLAETVEADALRTYQPGTFGAVLRCGDAVVFVDLFYRAVQVLSAQRLRTVAAGRGDPRFRPSALASDAEGGCYVADAGHRCLWHLDRTFGHLRRVFDLPESESGTLALTRGRDGTVWIWDGGRGLLSAWRPSSGGRWVESHPVPTSSLPWGSCSSPSSVLPLVICR